MFNVNGYFYFDDTTLHLEIRRGDHVALLTPVTGG